MPDCRVYALQVVGGGAVFSYAPCFVNLAPAAVSAFATGISVAPSLAVITPEGVNIQPQGLNIQPVSYCPPLCLTCTLTRSGAWEVLWHPCLHVHMAYPHIAGHARMSARWQCMKVS